MDSEQIVLLAELIIGVGVTGALIWMMQGFRANNLLQRAYRAQSGASSSPAPATDLRGATWVWLVTAAALYALKVAAAAVADRLPTTSAAAEIATLYSLLLLVLTGVALLTAVRCAGRASVARRQGPDR